VYGRTREREAVSKSEDVVNVKDTTVLLETYLLTRLVMPSRNVNVETSSDALLESPPPRGTDVSITASNPGTSPENNHPENSLAKKQFIAINGPLPI